jgi:hypothetical protein
MHSATLGQLPWKMFFERYLDMDIYSNKNSPQTGDIAVVHDDGIQDN